MMACHKDGKLLLCLSGNPGAAVIGLYRAALPCIRKLCGWKDIEMETVRVKLKEPLNKESRQMRMLRGRLLIEDGQAFFAAENKYGGSRRGGQGGGNMSSLLEFNLLGEIPAGSPPLDEGALIKAFRVN